MNNVYILLGAIGIILIFMLKKKRKHKRKAVNVVQVDNDKCARCRACVTKCRHQVLKMVNDKDGLHVEVAHPENCTSCGKCVDMCRFDALNMGARK